MKPIKAELLLVEDDQNLGYMLQDFLELEGYKVTWEKNGITALGTFKSGNFDLCILDIMLPAKDGFSLAEDIHRINPKIPFFFLTARALEADRIKGLKMGADDYMTKPFSTEELKLRIEIILRRVGKTVEPSRREIYSIGSVLFDFANQLLQLHGEEKRLTKKEALLLRMLCQNVNELVRREQLLLNIWGSDDYFMGRSMDVYIAKLRSYLREEPSVNIVNIHGTGFKLEIAD
ncbi:MAG: two-component system response regulator [Bacteroidetes bacterium GWF2_49_14]|nr:MAG: two-component system response regulator [Bacteroidetes bacterium GWF2_49_14]HBB93345.1 DNA-binding response regulator [Bacteroidales bacterium]